MRDRREIRFEIPFHIRAPDGFQDLDNLFYPRVSKFPIGIGFETLSDGQVRVGGMATIRKDKFGTLVRSRVRAVFHSEFEKLIPDDVPDKGIYPAGKWYPDRDGLYIKAAVDALNTLIEIYREETGSFWIRPLEMGDIGEFEIQDYEDGEVVRTKERGVSRGATVIGGYGREDLQTIQRRLEYEDSPNIYQTLHLDIIEKIDQSEFAVSVLLSYILLERWVKNAFVKTVVHRGKTEEAAKELIMKDEDEFTSLKNILVNCFKHHAGVDFRESGLYSQWEDIVREERNKVVHEDYIPDKESAQAMHETTIQCIEWIRGEIETSLEGEPETVYFERVREMDSPD